MTLRASKCKYSTLVIVIYDCWPVIKLDRFAQFVCFAFNYKKRANDGITNVEKQQRCFRYVRHIIEQQIQLLDNTLIRSIWENGVYPIILRARSWPCRSYNSHSTNYFGNEEWTPKRGKKVKCIQAVYNWWRVKECWRPKIPSFAAFLQLEVSFCLQEERIFNFHGFRWMLHFHSIISTNSLNETCCVYSSEGFCIHCFEGSKTFLCIP